MVFEKLVLIDGSGHLLGRLASTIAKHILNGGKVVVVRCEDINISGHFYKNKIKYLRFLNKRMNTKPSKGPIHFRAPSRILWRTVRGMIPHKTSRGAAAMERLKVFEGVPPPFDKMKKVIVPEALRVTRLQPGRKFTVLGRISHEVGWNHQEIVKTLEAKRRVKALAYYERKKALAALKVKAEANVAKAIAPQAKLLAAAGF
eukprot:GFYU01001330.1.p2 GENE.GFYU01001330.1~~GFYU01001330.1.p2  ORF type:complete len:202 (+),score=70.52 GFYU01001330.1:30-635(+)